MSDGADPAAGTDGAGLSSLARQLAAALPTDAAALAPPESASADAPPPPPAPALTPPPTLPVRRMPPAAALAVADRILAAASGRPSPAPAPAPPSGASASIAVTPSAPARPGPVPQPQPEHVPNMLPPAPIESNDGHTVRRGSYAADGAAIDLRLTDGRAVTVRSGQSVTIGRVGAAGVIGIDNPEISRRHVTVTMRPEGPVAVDEGSTNGTSVVRDGLWHDLAPGVEMALRVGDRLVVPDDIWLAHIVATAEGVAR